MQVQFLSKRRNGPPKKSVFTHLILTEFKTESSNCFKVSGRQRGYVFYVSITQRCRIRAVSRGDTSCPTSGGVNPNRSLLVADKKVSASGWPLKTRQCWCSGWLAVGNSPLLPCSSPLEWSEPDQDLSVKGCIPEARLPQLTPSPSHTHPGREISEDVTELQQ